MARSKGEPLPLDARFWPKVRLGPTCWEWTGYRRKNGYGAFRVRCPRSPKGWRMAMAHRVAYEIVRGPIPTGLEIDHLCRNRACVRPEHLEPVTHRVNSLRSMNLPAMNARKAACSKGHAFTEENTYLYRGKRQCRACASAGQIARRIEKRRSA